MVAILNKNLRIEESLSRILQVLSVNVFQIDTIIQLFMNNDKINNNQNPKQLMLNGF
jgi:hypothetical protein